MASDEKSLGWLKPMLVQGWASIAFWMMFGLLLEGLIGYKIPAYLEDAQRRELFRLAHTHGTLLGLLLVIGALCAKNFALEIVKAPRVALRLGVVLMPLGFFLSGIRHTETDPGLAIWLVPVAALLIIWAAIAFVLALLKFNDEKGQ
ncbi:MAG: hypothetical protein AB1757_22700 [Acidobacteriota bacterium]